MFEERGGFPSNRGTSIVVPGHGWISTGQPHSMSAQGPMSAIGNVQSSSLPHSWQDLPQGVTGRTWSEGQSSYAHRRSADMRKEYLLQQMEHELLQVRARHAEQLASTLAEIDRLYSRNLQFELEKCYQNYNTLLNTALARLRAQRRNQIIRSQEYFVKVISVQDEQNWPIQTTQDPEPKACSRGMNSQVKVSDIRGQGQKNYDKFHNERFQGYSSHLSLPLSRQYVSESIGAEAGSLRFGPLYPISDHQKNLKWI